MRPSLISVNPAINCLTGVTEQTLIHDLSMEQHKDFITGIAGYGVLTFSR